MASLDEELAPYGERRFLRLACVGSRGDPFVAPIRFVLDGTSIYFSAAPDLPLVVLLKAHRRVAVEADAGEEGGREGVMVQGLAQTVRGRGARERIVGALAAKYPASPPKEEDLLFQVVPVRILDLDGREK